MSVAAGRAAVRAHPRQRQSQRRAQRKRHLHSVPQAPSRARSAPRKASRTLFLVASWLVVVASIFGLVLLNVLVAQASFRLSDLRTQVADQERLYRQMRFEVARAEAPQRVAEIAGGLGLIVPDRQEYIVGRQTTVTPVEAEARPDANADNMKALLEGP